MTRRPVIDDVDPDTEEPKYKTFDEYAEASDAWTRASAIQDFKDMVAAGLIVLPEKRSRATYRRGRV